MRRFLGSLTRVSPLLAGLLIFPWHRAPAQETGTVTGTVTREDTGSPLAGVTIVVQSNGATAVTNTRGVYTLYRVPAGPQTLTFRWVGFAAVTRQVAVVGGTLTVDVAMAPAPVQLTEVVVEGASRAPERVVEAPAAITVIDPRVMNSVSLTGQAPLAFATVPGVDVVQNGVNDFNVNARGFNSSLNRRVLVLQDGRDLAIAFLGSQEWNASTNPLADGAHVEFVRGPGSALYGANAFTGVLAITTPAAREVVGTQLTVGGGELSTFRSDLRHAGVFGNGRFGYKISGGLSTSDSWSRSRTRLDGTSLRREYNDPTAPLTREVRALDGQTIDPATGAALGDPNQVQSYYGSGRFDYYAANGSVLTAEGGVAQVEDEIFVTGIGRVQVTKALRPWTRLNWSQGGTNVLAYWNGRNSLDPQFSLASGAPLKEKSDIFHIEGRQSHRFLQDRGRVTYGASFRSYQVNTSGTLMRPEDDDRSDEYGAVFTQVEYKIHPMVRLVGAIRFDDGSLISEQFSPKGAIVFSPNDRHSFRFTVNRAFQTPNYSEFFLRVAAGAPANFSALEAGLRASPLGPALAGVPNGQLFTNSAAVPVFARGNRDLDVEHVTSWEFGYRGDIGQRVSVSADFYISRSTNFVTDLLPGVNPTFGAWTSPTAVPQQFRGALEQAVRSQLLAAGQTLAAAGLTRTENGNTAIVVSYTNAGKVIQRGIELGAGVAATNELRFDGTFTFFDFTVDDNQVAQGDQLLPNTPKTKGTVSAAYRHPFGIDASVDFRFTSGYNWAAGVFAGRIRRAQTVNASLGWDINNNFRIFGNAVNLFDQRRFSIYGGSVNGRRVLGGLTTRF